MLQLNLVLLEQGICNGCKYKVITATIFLDPEEDGFGVQLRPYLSIRVGFLPTQHVRPTTIKHQRSNTLTMAATKRLAKERVSLERDPIPYITFVEDDDADEGNILEWKILLELSPSHDSVDEPSIIGCAASSPYVTPPSSPKEKKGILSGVTRKSKSTDILMAEAPTPAYFAFQFDFPNNYPFKPPAITVLTQSYHPNIKTSTGEICDAMLTGEGWGPTLNVKKVCAQLRKFLCNPDPDHPLESDIAQLLVDKPEEYAMKAWGHAGLCLSREKALAAAKAGKK
jgi:ubiquitin-protein ligase